MNTENKETLEETIDRLVEELRSLHPRETWVVLAQPANPIIATNGSPADVTCLAEVMKLVRLMPAAMKLLESKLVDEKWNK